ncbi:MAG: hypothetical protein JJE13_06275 [Thermoleophilia bacterium]|nr:hypothetical protein [Thermoleophilia bacterium]
MRLSDNRHHRHRFTLATLFLLALGLTAFGIAGLSSQAKAAPVSLQFDNGQVSIGELFKERKILPAQDTFPSPDLPTPQRTDIELMGTETNGQVSFPATTNTGLQFPYMYVLSPTDPTLKVPLTFRLKDPGLTGTYDAATGQMDLEGQMDVIVIVGLGANPVDPLIDFGTPPLGPFARCRIANVPVDLSTETKAPFTAQRFTGGFGENGALTMSWDDLPDAVIENGNAEQEGLCLEQLGVIIHGSGGLWLSNSVVNPVPQPPVELTCADDLRLCPVPTFVEISGTRVTPKKHRLKAGQTTAFKVKVTNSGTEDSIGTKVKLKSSNRKVKVRKTISLNVPAGSSATKMVKVKVKKSAKGKARITANASGFVSSATIKIKARKKKK